MLQTFYLIRRNLIRAHEIVWHGNNLAVEPWKCCNSVPKSLMGF